ncbi:MAG: DUF1501 domain-containing protein [Planctomycetota bacterium]
MSRHNRIARNHRAVLRSPHAGLDRRGFLGMSFPSALAMTLASRWGSANDGTPTPQRGDDHRLILLWLNGGPSHVDSFDPKTNCEEAGPYSRIQTRVPGLYFTDRLPKLADRANQLTVLRGLTGVEPEHNRARYYATTGSRPRASLDSPTLGAIVSHELGSVPMSNIDRHGLPAFVNIGYVGWNGPGFLGVEHSPFTVLDPEQRPINIDPPGGVDLRRFDHRLELLAKFEAGGENLAANTKRNERAIARQNAVALMRSRQLAAFEIAREKADVRDRYGRSRFGQSCLLARRLVEAGVRFIQVQHEGWDSHVENFTTHDRLLGELDLGMSALLDDLAERGLLENTLVVAMGEFGRTPRINKNAGRDHHAIAFSAALAGGKLRPGVVHGQTDFKGNLVVKDRITIPDFLATVLGAVNIDAQKQITTPANKPVQLIDKGTPSRELLES